MASSNILKFIDEKPQIVLRSKKCYPAQSNTCSRQSPDWFKRKFSLQPKNGYEYNFDDPKICQKFKFSSQKHSFHIAKNEPDEKDKVFDNNRITFHNKKKGVLTEFMNKNGWMKKVIPLMGTERSPEGRKLNHKDIQKKIEDIKLKKSAYIASKTTTNFYTTKSSSRGFSNVNSKKKRSSSSTNHKQTFQKFQNPEFLQKYSSNQEQQKLPTPRSSSMKQLFQQKCKVRQDRNKMVQNKILQISKMKIMKVSSAIPDKYHTIDSQFVKNRMTQTAREWGFGHGNGRKSTADEIVRLDSMISQHSTRLKLAQSNFRSVVATNNIEYIQNNKFASGQI